MRRHLAKFLMRLLKEIIDYPEAITAYNLELEYFKALGRKDDLVSQKQSKGGLAFLAYLGSYLRLRSFWLAWSKAGAIEASTRLNIAVDKVPRTNNHLESFNCRIKNKYFEAYSHAGRLPRLDLWVLIITTKIMPGFFQELRDRKDRRAYYAEMRRAPACRPCLPEPAAPTGPQLISPDSSSTSFDIASEDQNLFDEMIDDDSFDSDASDISSPNEEVFEDVDHDQAFSLLVDADGEGCSVVLEKAAAEDEKEDSMLWDNAVNESVIMHDIGDLRTSPIDSSMFSMSSSLCPPSPLFHLPTSPAKPENRPASPASTSLANAQATVMQEVLIAQDNLGSTLRRLRMLRVDDEILLQYTPPSLHTYVFGGVPNPAPITIPTAPASTDVENTRTGALIQLVAQKKEQCKPSYGIR